LFKNYPQKITTGWFDAVLGTEGLNLQYIISNAVAYACVNLVSVAYFPRPVTLHINGQVT